MTRDKERKLSGIEEQHSNRSRSRKLKQLKNLGHLNKKSNDAFIDKRGIVRWETKYSL